MIIRKLMLVGGQGYLGKEITKLASRLDRVSIKSIQRQYVSEENRLPNVEYIQEDVLHPKDLETHIKDSNAIIHTIGTLIDSTMTQGK